MMETLVTFFKDIGPWGILLLALIYIVLNSAFTLQYPRKSKQGGNMEK